MRLDDDAPGGVGRDLIPRVLAGLVRRGEDFDAAEDALQEALLEALRVWPEHPPRDPRAWLAAGATRPLRPPPPPAAPPPRPPGGPPPPPPQRGRPSAPRGGDLRRAAALRRPPRG